MRERFVLSHDEMRARYLRDLKTISLWSQDEKKPTLEDELNFRRYQQAKEKQHLRVARATIFAAGYSAMERFLLLRVPGCTGRENFPNLEKIFKKEVGEEIWECETFKLKWEKLDVYRVVRNKIIHQSGFIKMDELNEQDLAVFSALCRPVEVEDVPNVPGLMTILIQETFLDGYLEFLETFSTEIDGILRGANPC